MRNNNSSGISGQDFERRIFELLGRDIMSTSKLARELGMRRDIAAGYLEALKNQGKLDLFKVGRSYVYTLSRRQRK